MKILIVVTSIDPAAGGPTRSCKGLCRALSLEGVDVSLLVLLGKHFFENPCGVTVCYAQDLDIDKVGGWPLNFSDFDLVHIQGLWQLKLHKVVRACLKVGVPYVISPRGMLDPWALSVKKWKKRLAMSLYQRGDLNLATAFHATADMEAEHIRALGFKQPIFIAANGVDVPDSISTPDPLETGMRIAIFLSRLHPGKGLMTLAEAWAIVKPKGWVMRIVGPDTCGHKSEVLAKLEALGIRDQWQFVDMVDDAKKWQEYGAAEILIHPSVSENFGITIAEGLYAGLPVICTRGTPWKDVEDSGCGAWIDIGVEPLVSALAQYLNMPTHQLRELGKHGHELILQKYVWSTIARQVVNGYLGVLNE